MITLLSDFGSNSIYIARSKAWFKHHKTSIDLLDITHDIQSCDINEAAYVLRLLLDSFPEETIHLVAIDFSERHRHNEIVHIRYRNQHIITYNSGFVSVLAQEVRDPDIHHLGEYSGLHEYAIGEAFGAHALALTTNPKNDQSFALADQPNIKTALKPVINDDGIHGHLMYFDARGTGYTNIHRNDFDQFTNSGGFQIVLSRHERIEQITDQLEAREGGMTSCFFNSAGYLTISVYRGEASRLYGLRKGQNIIIEKK